MRTLSRTTPANQGGDAVATRPPGYHPAVRAAGQVRSAPSRKPALPFRPTRRPRSCKPRVFAARDGFSLGPTGTLS